MIPSPRYVSSSTRWLNVEMSSSFENYTCFVSNSAGTVESSPAALLRNQSGRNTFS